MASIIERKNRHGQTTSYQVKWREEGKQNSASFEDKAAADMFKKVLELYDHNSARAERQILSAASQCPSMEEVAQTHLKRLTDIGEHAMHTYERMLDLHINPKLGHLPADTLSEEDMAEWVGYMKDKGLAPKTIANVHGLIFSIMKTAVYKGHRTDNPCEHTRLPKSDHTSQKTTFLTKGEFSLLLQHIDPYFHPLILFTVGTGMRFSEIAALQPGDFSQEGDSYTVQVTKAWKRDTKNGRTMGPPKTPRARRPVPMDRALALVVAPLVAKCPSDGYVFKMKQGGELTTQALHHKVWGKARAAAQKDGLRKNPRIHDLRHTYASWMLNGDDPISLFELSRLMGHESVNTTSKVYSHQMKESLQRGANVMSVAMAGLIPEQPETAQIAN